MLPCMYAERRSSMIPTNSAISSGVARRPSGGEIDLIAQYLNGNDGGGTDGDVTSAAPDDGTLFAAMCAGCHGADGSGGSAPDLNLAVPALSDSELERVIVEGQNYMPPQDVTGADLTDLIGYLRVTHP